MFSLKHYKNIKNFDDVTKLRIINLGFISFSMGLIAPIETSLKGTYLLPWVISIFSILHTLAVKTNSYMINKLRLQDFYDIGILIHFLYIPIFLLFFYSAPLMVYASLTLMVVEVMVFSAFSIKLNTYLVDNFPQKMESFQVTRNSVGADSSIFGMSLAIIIDLFFGIGGSIIVFVILNLLLSLWLISQRKIMREENINKIKEENEKNKQKSNN